MNKLVKLDNLDIILKISEYLLEPAIVIDGHYYNNNGNFKLQINKKFINDQIDDVKKILSNKYYNKQNIFFNIIQDINQKNIFWRKIKHNIYINNKYIYKHWLESYFYIVDSNSYSFYSKSLYYLISPPVKYYDIKNIEVFLEMFHKTMKIKTFQYHMKYWGGYFNTYLENINNDLTKFKVTNLINFIKEEERIMSAFLDE